MGFFCTVALSWNLALWQPISNRFTHYWSNDTSSDLSSDASSFDKRAVYLQMSQFGTLRRMSSPDPGGDWFYAPRPIQSWSILEQKPVHATQLIVEDVHGWPRLGLRSTFQGNTIKPGDGWADSSWRDLALQGGIRIRPHLTDSQRYSPYYGSLAIPFDPLWVNFSINVLFWSVVWLIVPYSLFVYPLWYRLYRIRHNCCALCGYDLRGLSHTRCPECGVEIEVATHIGNPIPRWVRPAFLLLLFGAIATPVVVVAVQWQQPFTIHEAVAMGDAMLVRAAAMDIEDINVLDFPGQYGHTPLENALYRGDTDSVHVLLEYVASDVFETRSPLVAACFSGNSTLVALMLKHGADPNGTEYTTALPLAECLRSGANLEVVQMMLNHGAILNPPTSQYRLHPLVAAMYGYEENDNVINALIDSGADVNNTQAGGFTPLMAAAINGKSKTLIDLIELGADIHAKDMKQRTALEIAITSQCDYAAIRSLIEHGAVVKPLDYKGSPILTGALSNDDPIVFDLILSQPGIDINQVDAEGQTVLMRSVQNKWKPENVERLLDRGADPRAGDSRMWDILAMCVSPEIRNQIQAALDE